MSDHLRAVPNPMTRAERIDFLVAHMTANPDALRAFVAEVIDDTETLAAATAEIARLRDLLGLPTIHPTGRTHADQPREGANQ